MKQLIEDIAKALVDIPEEVSVRVVEGEWVTVFELRAARSVHASPLRALFRPRSAASGANSCAGRGSARAALLRARGGAART